MIARNEGTIINIRSIAGRKTFDNHSVYCGTKYAVHAMTESMRREVSGSNVRMIVIAPGVVETPLLSHTSNQEIKDNYNLWKQEIDGGLAVSYTHLFRWFESIQPNHQTESGRNSRSRLIFFARILHTRQSDLKHLCVLD